MDHLFRLELLTILLKQYSTRSWEYICTTAAVWMFCFAYTSCVIPESIMTNEYISLWKVLFIEWIIHECHFCLLLYDSSCDVSHSKNILKYTWAPSCLRMYLQILPWIFNAWILFTFYANVLLCLQEKCQVDKCVFLNTFS